MCTSIKLSSIFNKKRKYIVIVNFARRKILSKLSKNDLIGWFSHELAHIIDYETMSNFKLLKFTLKYLFSRRFRFSVEKRINIFAANKGFVKELFGVWKKFCSMDNISQKYKGYIMNNYRPLWKDVKKSAEVEGISKEFYET